MRKTTIFIFALLLLASANAFSNTVDKELSAKILEQYQAIKNNTGLNSVPKVDKSQLLLEIVKNWNKVSDDVKNIYETSRPDPKDFFGNNYIETGDTAYFCIWYKPVDYGGADTIRMADDNNNGIPDYVDSVLAYLHKAIKLYKDMGLNLPLKTNLSGEGLYDVFLSSECCGDNVYGFVFPTSMSGGDNPNTPEVETDCRYTQLVLRTNFDGQNWNLDHPKVQTALAVTTTHEFMHAVQNTYNASMATSMMEGIAVWAENKNYPTNYDGFMYAPTLLSYPNIPLNYLDGENATISKSASIKWYSTWLWFKYVTNRTSTDFIKQLYTAAIYNSNDISEYNTAFSKYNIGSLTDVVRDFYTTLAVASNNQNFAPYNDFEIDTLLNKLSSSYSLACKKNINYIGSAFTPYSNATESLPRQLYRLGADYFKITSKQSFVFTVQLANQSDNCAVVLVKKDKFKDATKVQVINIPKNENGIFTSNVSIDVNDSRQDYTSYYIIVNNLNTDFNLTPLTYTFSLDKGVTGISETTMNGSNYLVKAYPNPCNNGESNLSININTPQTLNICVYDVRGQKVKTLMNNSTVNSDVNLPLNFNDLPKGTYYIQIDNGSKVSTQMIVND